MSVVLSRKGGFDVSVSEDVAEIMALARSGDLGAIIMDISLSRTLWEGRRVDGVFITKMLKADPATAGIPVIIATAHAMTGDRERLMAETGADHYLAKPIHDPALFLEEIRKVLPAGA
jgi:CheY-like chemotaxis protein